jgi:uncharacterized protein (UPF0261 family)
VEDRDDDGGRPALVSAGRTPVIAVLATLDTKAQEAQFVAAELRSAGLRPLLVDLSLQAAVPGAATGTAADVTTGDIAAAAGLPPAALFALPKTELMMKVARAAASLLGARVAARELDGVLGLGGGSGTWLVARAVGGLPLTFPKMLVTTGAGRLSAGVLEGTDIVVVPSITDIAGLNPILRRVLGHAARAIGAMAAPPAPDPAARPPGAARGLIGMTMFGVTTAGGTVARRRLEQAGYDVAVFHANGLGGRILERLAAEGALAGVLDWTTTELTDELAGGRCSAGPGRLDAAARAGLPQVVVPGAVDVINAGDPGSLPERFRGRLMHLHRADSALIRASAAESQEVGRIIGRKLAAARGPVRVVVPLGGFSSLDAAGGPFRDRPADDRFLDGLNETARPPVVVEVSAANINDPPFAALCAERLLDQLDPEGR